MIVAIDGPAASGKGTLARRLAKALGFAYLDTGALYRAVALRVRDSATDPDDEAAVAALAQDPGNPSDPRLRDDATAEIASRISALPTVRAALLEYQRAFAANPPGGPPGAVLEGRDIGTVVCPDAERKIFLTAQTEERARRRHAELIALGESVTEDQVLADIRDRDRRDRDRSVSPLKPAPGAYLLDTTNLDIDSAFKAAKAYALSGRPAPASALGREPAGKD
ncbi:MAG TPA: d(CMP) kinase [Alphaproteobacteria bacterium]|jgi:cytidylate kinase|nr:d(CMP) kinase [Alphaproteobacteria bacterium]